MKNSEKKRKKKNKDRFSLYDQLCLRKELESNKDEDQEGQNNHKVCFENTCR